MPINVGLNGDTMRFKNLHTILMNGFLQLSKTSSTLSLVFFLLFSIHLSAEKKNPLMGECDNITDGGIISGDESGCNNPTFDPGLIASVTPATGGSGAIEYIWMKTTNDPNSPFNTWQIIPGANAETYDPEPITETTYYARCSRRFMCIEYLGETNIVTKEVKCCNFNAAISPLDATVCMGNILDFSVTASGEGLNYLWEASGGSFNDPTSANPSYTMMTPGTYGISVTISNDDCEEELNTTVTIGNSLTVEITADHDYIALNEPLALGSNVSGGTNLTYNWTATGGNFDDSTIPNPVYTAGTIDTFNVLLTVTDESGCEGKDTFTVRIGECNLIILGTIQDASCSGIGDGSINVTVQNSEGIVNYNWDNGIGNTAFPTGLSPGIYGVTISDLECSDTASFSVGEGGTLQLNANAKSPNCVGGSDGQILIIPNNGTSPFTYSWSDNLPDSFLVQNLSAGDYTVTVTDDSGCSVVQTITVDDPTPITLMINVTDADCGENNGSASVTASGGLPDYTYNWSDSNNQQTATATNLGSGNYVVTVMDSQGCTAIENITINAIGGLSLNTIVTNASCGGSDGAIDLTINGGKAPFSINWDNGIGAVEDPSNLESGTYMVEVRDSSGCFATEVVIVGEDGSINVNIMPINISCHGGNDGMLSVIATSGTSPFSYQWSDGLGDSTVINNLTANTYSVTVTDSTGCSSIATATLIEPDPISLTVIPTSAGCDSPTGSAVAEVSGGTAGYSFQWNDSNNQITQTAINLVPGDYTVTVTDANGCIEIATTTVTNSQNINFFITPENASICGGEEVQFTSSINDNSYSYSWTASGGSFNDAVVANPVYTMMSPGTYTIIATASSGNCVKSDTSVVTVVDNIVLSAMTTTSNCSGTGTGSIDLTIDSRSDNPTINWDNGLGSVEDPSGLAPGTYTVTVTGDNNCSASLAVTVDADTGLIVTVTTTPVLCSGEHSGAIAVNVANGTPPYTYQWNNSLGNFPGFTGLAQGIYQVTVTDANGCTGTASGKVHSPDPLLVTSMVEDADCGEDNGRARVDVSGGTAPYSYLWSAPLNQTTAAVSGLAPGSYGIAVMDNNGCSSVDTLTVNRIAGENCNPDTCVVDGGTISTTDSTTICAGDGNADLINVTLTGVVGANSKWFITDNTFNIISFPTAPPFDFEGAGAGTCLIWNVSYQDSIGGLVLNNNISSLSGCFDLSNFITIIRLSGTDCIPQDTCVDLDLVALVTDVTCAGDNTGAINVTVNNGTPPYSYNWNMGIGNVANPTGLMAGTYSLTVTDSLGCTAVEDIIVGTISNLSLSLSSTNVLCGGENEGSVAVVANGGIAPLNYSWSNGMTGVASINNLAPGTYVVTVTDDVGCQKVDSVSITDVDPLIINANASDIGCGETGFAFVSVSGGTPPYQYAWSDGANQATDTAFNLAAGKYFVTVTDDNNCSAVDSVTINETGDMTCAISVLHDITVLNGADGRLAASASGGSGGYTYQWNNGGMDSVINNLSANTYIVTVTDNSGCNCIDTFKLENPAKIGDFVFEDTDSNGIQDPAEIGISGLPLRLTGTNYYGGFVSLDTLSDANGMYMFWVPPGTYKLTVLDVLGLNITKTNQGDDDDLDSDIDTISLMSHLVSVAAGDIISNLDIGLIPSFFCDNVLSGGSVTGNEVLCGPDADPAPITNLVFPSGGSGELEYLWLMSHKPSYTPGDPDWLEIPNSNSPNYDPGIINDTTYYIRCARRKGCDNYPGESNIIRKAVKNCVEEVPSAENLRAQMTEEGVELVWDGKTPNSADNFIIEKSENGINFSVLGTMQGQLSEEMKEYHYMDEAPSFGENYYRIKVLHPDYKYTFSNIAMAMVRPNNNQRVMIYPNPVQSSLTIHFFDDIEETAVVQIINGFGQILRRIEIDMPAKKYQLDLSELPSGMYYIKFDNKKLKRIGQKIYKVEE